jgi:hypothetical protein
MVINKRALVLSGSVPDVEAIDAQLGILSISQFKDPASVFPNVTMIDNATEGFAYKSTIVPSKDAKS